MTDRVFLGRGVLEFNSGEDFAKEFQDVEENALVVVSFDNENKWKALGELKVDGIEVELYFQSND